MGKIISGELREKNIRFVIVRSTCTSTRRRTEGLLFPGDATKKERGAERTRIDKAKGLISVLPTDAENFSLF